MKWKDLIPLVFVLAGGTMAAFTLRSPKDQGSQSGRPMRHVRTLDIKAKIEAAKAKHDQTRKVAQLAVARDHTFHIFLMCDPYPNPIQGYRWYRGVNSLPNFAPTNAIFTTNNWVSESNLWHGSNYEFVVSSIGTDGTESAYSAIVRWPRPRTNHLALGVSESETNAWATNTDLIEPATSFYRLLRVPGAYELHSSPNFRAWTTVTQWPMANPLPNFYLRSGKWDGVSGFEHDD